MMMSSVLSGMCMYRRRNIVLYMSIDIVMGTGSTPMRSIASVVTTKTDIILDTTVTAISITTPITLILILIATDIQNTIPTTTTMGMVKLLTTTITTFSSPVTERSGCMFLPRRTSLLNNPSPSAMTFWKRWGR